MRSRSQSVFAYNLVERTRSHKMKRDARMWNILDLNENSGASVEANSNKLCDSNGRKCQHNLSGRMDAQYIQNGRPVSALIEPATSGPVQTPAPSFG